MEHTITLTNAEYRELEGLKLEVDSLKKELEKEKDKKNGYLFLRTSLTGYNPFEGKAIKFGIIDYSVESVKNISIEKPIIESAVNTCISYLLINRFDKYILTKDDVNTALDKIDKEMKFLEEERIKMIKQEEKLNNKLAKLPKWLKWFLWN